MRALERFLKLDAMPVLNNVRARGTQTQQGTPTRALVQGRDSAGNQRGRARIDIRDSSAHFNALCGPQQVAH